MLDHYDLNGSKYLIFFYRKEHCAFYCDNEFYIKSKLIFIFSFNWDFKAFSKCQGPYHVKCFSFFFKKIRCSIYQQKEKSWPKSLNPFICLEEKTKISKVI